MGALYAFDLQPYIDKYNLKTYFETGTGEAISLRHALKYAFSTHISIDIDPDLIENARSLEEKHSQLVLKTGLSKDIIREMIPQLSSDEPTLFFLDAHFPGADFHKISYEESIRSFRKDAFPLEEEVFLITSLRDISRDVFIIDDLMLYEKEGDYESIKEGVIWKYEWLQQELGLETSANFLYEAFSATHDCLKDLRHQGYLIVTPKDMK